MQLIDSHCHLDFAQFDHDRDEVLARCRALDINDIIIPGVRCASWDMVLKICQQSDMLHYALGLHPMFMQDHSEDNIARLRDYVNRYNPVAIGEIGLDFYLKDHDKNSQTTLFEQQLNIAAETQLPVILHVRKAHEHTIALLKKHSINKGIVHAFSGSLEQAQQYIKQGFLLGVGGVITYPNAHRVRRLYTELPLSSLALETDAPDMPLHGMLRDQRNSPEKIADVLSQLSQLREETVEQIANATTQNVQQLLAIDS